MEDKIKSFDTFEAFYEWLQDDSTGEQGLKTKIRRATIENTRQEVKGDTVAARNKAMLKIGYEERLSMLYGVVHG